MVFFFWRNTLLLLINSQVKNYLSGWNAYVMTFHLIDIENSVLKMDYELTEKDYSLFDINEVLDSIK